MKIKHLAGALVVLAVIAATSWLAWHAFRGRGKIAPPVDQVALAGHDAASGAVDPATYDRITLSDEKIANAGIQTAQVRRGTLQLTRTIPARFAYDDTRHISLRTPTDGVLESVLVRPASGSRWGKVWRCCAVPQSGWHAIKFSPR